MASGSAVETRLTPYELLGGNEAAVRRIVDRFYDLVENAPEARELRAMHADDLRPMREKLTWFMTGWLGGPPRYAQRNRGSACITEAHQRLRIDAQASRQWMWCMRRALEDVDTPEEFREMIDAPLARFAQFLRNR